MTSFATSLITKAGLLMRSESLSRIYVAEHTYFILIYVPCAYLSCEVDKAVAEVNYLEDVARKDIIS